MEPKMERQTTTSALSTNPPKPRACESCTRRKIRCDKISPQCSACIKSRIACHYGAPVQGRPKRKATTDIHERLDKYEKLLERHGLLGAPRDSREVETVMNPFLQPHRIVDPAKNARHVEGPMTEISESHFFNMIRDAARSVPHEGRTGSTHPGLGSGAALASAALFGTVPSNQSLGGYHPTYEIAMKLWSLYQRNVDPLIKLLHIPTTGPMLEKAAANPFSISDKEDECLVLALYHITALTLSESEVRDVFGQPGDVRDKYHDALRIALINCQYYKTSSLKVLQALLLLLLSVRGRTDPDTLWTLTGNAMRIAQRMKIHRDGTELGLTPYETELRRRLWSVMIPLDTGTGRLCGVSGGPVLPTFWDTKRPLNINDDDIHPGTTTTPEPRHGATEMMFLLVKTEIGGFHQRIRHKIGGWFRETDSEGLLHFEQALKTLKTNIEEKYIRYCDITLPVHYFTVAMARAALDYGELQLRLQQDKKSMSLSQKRAAFTLALRILDHDIACTLNPAISRFAWFRADFLQWGPLIWILNELASSQRDAAETETAWEKIDQVYNCHPELQTCSRSIDLALGKLVLVAWDMSMPRRPEPGFIPRIRSYFTAEERVPETNQWNGDFGPAHQDLLGALNMDVDWQFWEQIIGTLGTSTLES